MLLATAVLALVKSSERVDLAADPMQNDVITASFVDAASREQRVSASAATTHAARTQ